MSALDTLTADVAAQTSVIQSAVTLLGTLKTKLDDAIAANNAGDNGAALATLSAELESNTGALANAVAVNTPAQQGAAQDGGAGQAAAAAPAAAPAPAPAAAPAPAPASGSVELNPDTAVVNTNPSTD